MKVGVQPPQLGVILCGVLEKEFEALRQEAPHIITHTILEQGLHNTPETLRESLQAAITGMEEAYQDIAAIALLYGLCSRGAEGVSAARCRLVLPRAHDCMTLLLGSKERYADYVAAHPGTYWYSPGWIATGAQPGKERYEKTLAEYRCAYDEDDATYLMEMEQGWFREYNRATYVDLGLTETGEDVAYTKECAAYLSWEYDRQHGDPSLLHGLLHGCWDSERFLILQPGESAKMVLDNRVIDVNKTKD